MKKIKAYAKINLRLKVINSVNINGTMFHNLEMINRKIGLHDEISITKASIDSIEYVYNKEIREVKVNFENDIIFKAYKSFKEKYLIKDNYLIIINRNIPVGSGLGANPACIAEIYKFLNKTYHLDLSLDELSSLGSNFGKDVSYMLTDKMSIVRGFGEKIYPIKDSIKDDIIVIYPNIQVSTQEVFNRCNITNSEININSFNYDLLCNDLEYTTCHLYPELVSVKTYLSRFNIKKMVMTGTGSSYILIVDKKYTKDIYNKIVNETNYFVYIERN